MNFFLINNLRSVIAKNRFLRIFGNFIQLCLSTIKKNELKNRICNTISTLHFLHYMLGVYIRMYM